MINREDISEIDLAYAAGIIDGEGCIGIWRDATRTRRRGYCITLRVKVDMVDFVVPTWLKTKFGGSLRLSHKKGNRRDQYSWLLTARQARDFLGLVLPYLKTKRTHAEVAIEFQNLKVKLAGGRDSLGRFALKSKALCEGEEILEKKMRDFNKRGIDGYSGVVAHGDI